MRNKKMIIDVQKQASEHVLVIKEHRFLLWILLLLLLPLCANAQQPEQLVRDYVSKLDAFLMSPNSFEKREAFEKASFLQGCYFKDDIYIKYKNDSRIEDCMAKDYAGLLADAINANQRQSYANVKIVRDLSKSNNGGIYEVTAYLQYTGAIEMRTVTVFHVKDGKILGLTNDFVKTKEWNTNVPPVVIDDNHNDNVISVDTRQQSRGEPSNVQHINDWLFKACQYLWFYNYGRKFGSGWNQTYEEKMKALDSAKICFLNAIDNGSVLAELEFAYSTFCSDMAEKVKKSNLYQSEFCSNKAKRGEIAVKIDLGYYKYITALLKKVIARSASSTSEIERMYAGYAYYALAVLNHEYRYTCVSDIMQETPRALLVKGAALNCDLARTSLAKIYLQENRYEQAKSELEKVIANNSINDAVKDAYYMMFVIYFLNKDYDNAYLYFKKAQDAFQTSATRIIWIHSAENLKNRRGDIKRSCVDEVLTTMRGLDHFLNVDRDLWHLVILYLNTTIN